MSPDCKKALARIAKLCREIKKGEKENERTWASKKT